MGAVWGAGAVIIKIVLLFLVLIGLLGMTGRFRSISKPKKKDGPVIKSAVKCPKCGTYLVGDSPCNCGGSGDSRS